MRFGNSCAVTQVRLFAACKYDPADFKILFYPFSYAPTGRPPRLLDTHSRTNPLNGIFASSYAAHSPALLGAGRRRKADASFLGMREGRRRLLVGA